MTASHRFQFFDLLSHAPLGQFELSGVSYGRRISSVGGMEGTITLPYTGSDTELAQRVRAIIPAYSPDGRFNPVPPRAVVVSRSDGGDFAPWWGGIVQTAATATEQTGAVTVKLQAATWEQWLHDADLERDLPDLLSVDQFDIARGFWSERQAQTGGNIGVELGDETSGVLRDRTGYKMANKVNLGEALDQLAQVQNGFEHTIDDYQSGGTFHKRLRLAETIAGDNDPPLFTLSPDGGNVLAFGGGQDYTRGGTVFYARGQADSDNAVASVSPPVSNPQSADDLLAAGWPRIVRMNDYDGVSSVTALDSHAKARLALYRGVVSSNTATVSVEGTSWTPRMIGSVHRFKIDNALMPGVEVTRRVVGWKLTAAQGGSAEKVELEFDNPGAG